MNRNGSLALVGLTLFLSLGTYCQLWAADVPPGAQAGQQLRCEVTASYVYPIGPRVCKYVDPKTGEWHMVRERGWVGGVFIPSLGLWCQGVREFVFGNSEEGLTCPTVCAACGTNPGRTTVQCYKPKASMTATQPLARVPYPVNGSSQAPKTTMAASVPANGTQKQRTETTHADWKPLPEPGRLQLTAATEDMPLDIGATSDNSEIRITWAPPATNGEPPLFSEAVASEAPADIVPCVSIQEVEQKVDTAANASTEPERPCLNDDCCDCESNRDDLLVRCIDQLQRWRTWLAVAGMSLILLGWVGRSTFTK